MSTLMQRYMILPLAIVAVTLSLPSQASACDASNTERLLVDVNCLNKALNTKEYFRELDAHLIDMGRWDYTIHHVRLDLERSTYTIYATWQHPFDTEPRPVDFEPNWIHREESYGAPGTLLDRNNKHLQGLISHMRAAYPEINFF